MLTSLNGDKARFEERNTAILGCLELPIVFILSVRLLDHRCFVLGMLERASDAAPDAGAIVVGPVRLHSPQSYSAI